MLTWSTYVPDLEENVKSFGCFNWPFIHAHLKTEDTVLFEEKTLKKPTIIKVENNLDTIK